MRKSPANRPEKKRTPLWRQTNAPCSCMMSGAGGAGAWAGALPVRSFSLVLMAGLEPARPGGQGIFLPHYVAIAAAVPRCGLDYVLTMPARAGVGRRCIVSTHGRRLRAGLARRCPGGSSAELAGIHAGGFPLRCSDFRDGKSPRCLPFHHISIREGLYHVPRRKVKLRRRKPPDFPSYSRRRVIRWICGLANRRTGAMDVPTPLLTSMWARFASYQPRQ